MTRLTGPDESYRPAYTPDGRIAAQGDTGRLYADAAGTTPADVLLADSTVIPVVSGAAQVTIDAYSNWPKLQYPASGANLIYGSVNGGPIVKLYADFQPQIDAKTPTSATVSKTANFTAAVSTIHLADTTAGSVTGTLPAANVAGQQVELKLNAGTNPLNVAVTGSDTIGPAATSAAITLTGESWLLTSSGTGQWNITGGNKTLPSLDARYIGAAAGLALALGGI